MKIVIVAPLHDYRKYSIQPPPDSKFFLAQGQYFWTKSLRESGHEVLEVRNTDYTGIWAVDFFLNSKRLAYRLVIRIIEQSLMKRLTLFSALKSRRDRDRIIDFNPEMIIFSGGNWLAVYTRGFFESLSKRLPNCRMVLLNGMSPSYYKVTIEKKIFPFIECIYMNDRLHEKEWMDLGARDAKMLPVSAMYPREFGIPKEKRIQVSSVGSFYEDRHKIFEFLYENGVEVKVWGSVNQKIPSDSPFWKFYQGSADATEIGRIYSDSKIGINIHSASMPSGGNLRTFEIPFYGCLQMIDNFDPAWFIEDEEIVRFKDKEELLEKVRFYLADDDLREKVAAAGRLRVMSSHTYKSRMDSIINRGKVGIQ